MGTVSTDQPPPRATAPGTVPPKRRDTTALSAVVIALLSAAWLFFSWEPVPTGADAPGYYVAGRMLAEHGTTVLRPESPVQYIGAHWLDAGDGRFVSRYPPGVSSLVALLYAAGGPELATALNLILAAFVILLVALWGTRWMPAPTALAAAAIVAMLAAFAEQSLLGFSHLPTTAALMGALYFTDRWRESAGRLDAVAAGLLVGSIPALRLPEALPAVIIVAWVLLHLRSARHTRTAPLLALAALVPLGALALHNERLFGSPLASAYGFTGEAGGFGVEYFVAHFVPYLGTLARNLGPSFVLGGLALPLMVIRGGHGGRAWLLVGIMGGMTAAYMAFFWPFADVRYLLPTLPLWVLSAAWLVSQLRSQRLMLALGALLIVGHQALFAVDALPRTRRIARFADRMRTTSDAVRDVVPRGSVVIAPGAFASLMEYRGEWKLADWRLFWAGPLPPRPAGVPAPLSNDGKPQPSPEQRDKGAALRRRYAGLDERARIHAAIADAEAWSGGAGLYWIGDATWIHAVSPLIAPRWRLELVATIGMGTPLSRERPWWLPLLPMDVYRVVSAHGDAVSAPTPAAPRAP